MWQHINDLQHLTNLLVNLSHGFDVNNLIYVDDEDADDNDDDDDGDNDDDDADVKDDPPPSSPFLLSYCNTFVS